MKIRGKLLSTDEKAGRRRHYIFDADNSSVRTYPSLHNTVCFLLKVDHCDKS